MLPGDSSGEVTGPGSREPEVLGGVAQIDGDLHVNRPVEQRFDIAFIGAGQCRILLDPVLKVVSVLEEAVQGVSGLVRPDI